MDVPYGLSERFVDRDDLPGDVGIGDVFDRGIGIGIPVRGDEAAQADNPMDYDIAAFGKGDHVTDREIVLLVDENKTPDGD